MRNALFVFALGMAAIVHFTHQLFPNFTAAGPAHGLVEGLRSTRYAPPAGPAVWLPESESTRGNAVRASSVCVVDSVDEPAQTLSASLQGPAPSCGVSRPPTKGVRGL